MPFLDSSRARQAGWVRMTRKASRVGMTRKAEWVGMTGMIGWVRMTRKAGQNDKTIWLSPSKKASKNKLFKAKNDFRLKKVGDKNVEPTTFCYGSSFS